jgi:hypothetical protein
MSSLGIVAKGILQIYKKRSLFFYILISIIISFLLVIMCFEMFTSSTYNYFFGDGENNLNLTQQQFFAKIAEPAREIYKSYNLFPSIQIAQAILESNWGKSGLTIRANNLFGIKTTSNWKGDTCIMSTNEEVNGVLVVENASFRVYSSWHDSIIDHANFLKENPRYTIAGVFSSKTPEEQAIFLQSAGYATDHEYSDKLINIIYEYNLKKFDSDMVVIEREKLLLTARSLIGKVQYVWGGKGSLGVIPTGLDCSGFVDWVFQNSGGGTSLSGGTTLQWNNSVPISESELLPGDLGFKQDPFADGINHIGIYTGTKDGQKVFVHCTGGVGVIEGNVNVFKYWRRPSYITLN